MGKPGPKAYSIINDLLKKGSPFKQQKLNKQQILLEGAGGAAGEMAGKASGKKSKLLKRNKKYY